MAAEIRPDPLTNVSSLASALPDMISPDAKPELLNKGSFNNYVDMVFPLFDYLLTSLSMDMFYPEHGHKVHFWTLLPTSSCTRSY